jgi:hypothetical protein
VKQPFADATLLIEQMGRPLVHAVIPLIDKLTELLEDTGNDPKKPPIVRAAALAGYKHMNKYYAKTDESIVYRLAMRMCFNVLLKYST